MFWLLYCLPLLFQVLQRNDLFGSGCYIAYHCSLLFDRGVVHFLVGYIVSHYCLRFAREVVHVVVCYIVYYYCLSFVRGVVHAVIVILSAIAVYGLTEEWFMLWLLYCLLLLF